MRHPFDGIQTESKPVPSPRSTRRSALGRMLAVVGSAVGIGSVARAQAATTKAVGEEGGRKETRALNEQGGIAVTRAINENGMTNARVPAEAGLFKPAHGTADLTEKQLEEAWVKLTNADPAQVADGWRSLYSAKQAVPFLKGKLKVDGPAVDEKQVGPLIGDLDADDFATREQATATLAKMGPDVVPALNAAVSKTGSLEVKRRLEMILVKVRESDKVAQARHGLRVLAELPTKEARELIEGIGKQTPETWLTQEARVALQPRPVDPKILNDRELQLVPQKRAIELQPKR